MKLMFISLVTLLLFIFSLDLFSENRQVSISAADGVLDLREWDFDTDGQIKLYGGWQFSWHAFVPPEEPMPRDNTSIISIPSYWYQHNHMGRELPQYGWATYRLDILLPQTDKPLALNYKYIFTAYDLYINGKLADSCGTPGTGKDSSTPGFKQEILTFTPENREINLTMHVSNFDLNKGGIWESMILGNADTIIRATNTRLALEMLIISSILIMGMYHFGIFFYRHEDKTALYFGIFCILIALRALTTGEIFIQKMFPGIGWALMLRIEYLGFYAAVPVFLMYIHSIYPDYISSLILGILQIVTVFFVLSVAGLPPRLFNKGLIAYQSITAAAAVYVIIMLIRAAARKRDNSRILLFGFFAIFAAFLNDLLHSNEIIHTGLFLPAGLFVFIFSQAILILNRTNITYRTIEKQALELQESYKMFERSRLGTILGLAKLAEYRDEDTGTHLERIREYCKLITIRLSENNSYKDYITSRYIDDIYQSSILHDIGKVGVPDAVLLKKGRLDDAEFEQIKIHTNIGGDALLNIESRTNMKSFLTLGKEIAWYHHEKWDGSGYPKGLRGKEIPLSARITAVADVYDALTSERPYKKAFSHEKAMQLILEGRGTHFDPEIVDIFLEIEREFDDIRRSHLDNSII